MSNGQDIIRMDHEMPNGVTVSDWLGTAGVAATLASNDLERLRDDPYVSFEEITAIRERLLQALTEVHIIMGQFTS